MQFLLDTHTFIWFINGDDALPKEVVNGIKDIRNKCFLSIASIWEIAIKSSLQKLDLKSDFAKIGDFLEDNDIEILPITFEHIQVLTTLPFHHRDPFDRLIISQGVAERLVIMSKDDNFKKYQVNVKW